LSSGEQEAVSSAVVWAEVHTTSDPPPYTISSLDLNPTNLSLMAETGNLSTDSQITMN